MILQAKETASAKARGGTDETEASVPEGSCAEGGERRECGPGMGLFPSGADGKLRADLKQGKDTSDS